MGGSGTRMGAAIPKQFLEVNGKPVYYYIVEQYARMQEIAAICIVCPREWLSSVENKAKEIPFDGRLVIAEGGATRSHSVRNGLKAIESSIHFFLVDSLCHDVHQGNVGNKLLLVHEIPEVFHEYHVREGRDPHRFQ